MKKALMIALVAAVSVVAITGCESPQSKPMAAAPAAPAVDPAKAAAEAAIAKAQQAQKAAAKIKSEWRDTGKMIKSAQELLAKGDYAGAEKMAKKAETQGHDAVAQAATQKDAGNPGYLY